MQNKFEVTLSFDKLNLTLSKIYALLTLVNKQDFFAADEITLRSYFAIIEDLTNDALLINEHIADFLQR